MPDAHTNFAYSTIATAPSPASSGTSLTVANGDGAKFPTAPFNVTVWPAGAQPTTTNAEIVRVTNKGSGDDWTITRTQEGTSARAISIGDQIAATITVKALTDVEDRLLAVSVSNNLYSSGTVVISGGNNITVGTNNGTVTISAFNQTAESNTLGASNLGNTVGTSGVVSGNQLRLLFAGGNNITLSQSLNGSSGTITISAFNQTAPVVSNAIQAVSSATNSGTATSQFAAHDHVHAGVGPIGLSNIGNTIGNTGALQGRMIFAGGNNITLSGSTSNNNNYTITISAFNQTAPVVSNAIQNVGTATGSGTATSQFAAHDHVHRGIGGVDVNAIASTFVGQLELQDGNLLALSTGGASNAGSVAFHNLLSSATTVSGVASANAVGAMASRFALEGHQHAGVAQVQISGNTSNTSNVVLGSLVLAGGNNITLSQVSAAGAATITISAAGNTASTFAGGVSTGGNTAGDTGIVSQQMVLVGGNNITLSQSTNGQSATVTISAGAGGGGGFSAGMSNLGLTAGTSGTVGSQLVLVGTDGIKLSQSVNGNSATLSIYRDMSIDYYQNMDRGTSAVLAVPANTFFIQRLNQENDLFAADLTASTFLLNLSGSCSTGASSTQTLAAFTTSLFLGIYTEHNTNRSVLTLIDSVSTSFGSNNTMSIYPHHFGNRWVSFHSSQWSSQPVFTQGGDYIFGILARTSGASTAMSFIGQSFMNSQLRSGYFGVSTTTGNAISFAHGNFWNGVYTATTAALPVSISSNAVSRAHSIAVFVPHIVLHGKGAF